MIPIAYAAHPYDSLHRYSLARPFVTEMWNSNGGLSFRSRALERDAMVLGSGWVEFND